MKRATLALALAASLTVIAAPLAAQEKGAKAPAAPEKAEKAEKATDPVCGMKVDPKTSPSATYKGKTYYFCSPSEKAEFEKNPEKYLKKKPA